MTTPASQLLTRYEYELYSGRVASASSESLVSGMLTHLEGRCRDGRWLPPASLVVVALGYHLVGGAATPTLSPYAAAPFLIPLCVPHLRAGQNWLLAAARRVGVLRRSAVCAVHTLLVETPGGQQRTFRQAEGGGGGAAGGTLGCTWARTAFVWLREMQRCSCRDSPP